MSERDLRAEWHQLDPLKKQIVGHVIGDAFGLYEILSMVNQSAQSTGVDRAREMLTELLTGDWIALGWQQDPAIPVVEPISATDALTLLNRPDSWLIPSDPLAAPDRRVVVVPSEAVRSTFGV